MKIAICLLFLFLSGTIRAFEYKVDETVVVSIIRESGVEEALKNEFFEEIDDKGILKGFVYPLILEIRKKLDEGKYNDAEKLAQLFFMTTYQEGSNKIDDRRELTAIRRDGPSAAGGWETIFDRGSELLEGAGRACSKGCGDGANHGMLVGIGVGIVAGVIGAPMTVSAAVGIAAPALCISYCVNRSGKVISRNYNRGGTRSAVGDNRDYFEP